MSALVNLEDERVAATVDDDGQQFVADPVAKRMTAVASVPAESIQTNAKLRAKVGAAVLHGNNNASKRVYFGCSVTVAQLRDSVTVTFDKEALKSVFQVHGRSEERRKDRVGDISRVHVTGVTLLSSYSSYSRPVGVVAPFPGKVYPILSASTGRASGKEQRLLATVNPGPIKYGDDNVVYSQLHDELRKMALVTGSFNPDELTVDCKRLEEPGYEAVTLVPQGNYISHFISTHADMWRLNETQFHKVAGVVAYPPSLVDFVVSLLSKMHAHVSNQMHNLGNMYFRLQDVSGDRNGLLTGSEEAFVALELNINYAFLDQLS